MGSSFVADSLEMKPLNKLSDSKEDGCYLNARCMGSYIHGILDNGSFIDFLLLPYADKLKIKPIESNQFKEEQFDKLADHIRKYVDVQNVYNILSR